MNRFNNLLAQKEIRDNKRYRQTDIANETGLSKATVSRWMKGGDVSESTIHTAQLLCEWLGCDLADLVYLEPETAN